MFDFMEIESIARISLCVHLKLILVGGYFSHLPYGNLFLLLLPLMWLLLVATVSELDAVL